jgi:hypothetical protein
MITNITRTNHMAWCYYWKVRVGIDGGAFYLNSLTEPVCQYTEDGRLEGVALELIHCGIGYVDWSAATAVTWSLVKKGEPPPKADGDPLRARLTDTLARVPVKQSWFANHAGLSQATISKFIHGMTVGASVRRKVEVALADLDPKRNNTDA